jgi:coronin-7
VLGPEELPVEVLRFHPTVDGVLVSAAGRAVKVWDAAKQQPLTGMVTLTALSLLVFLVT